MRRPRSSDRLRVVVGLGLGIVLAVGAPGIQYAATQLSNPVGEYSYPQRPVFLGRATAVSIGGARVADTGAIRTRRPGTTDATFDTLAGPVVTAEILPSRNHRRLFARRGAFDPLSASISGVTRLRIDTPLGLIEAEAVGAIAAFSCGGHRQAATRIVRLRIDGQPVPGVNAPPGTVIDVGAFRLEINRQSRPGPSQIAVTALRIRGSVPLVASVDVAIGHARAGVRRCGPVERAPRWAPLLQGARPPLDPFEQRGKDAALGCLDGSEGAITPGCAMRHRPAVAPVIGSNDEVPRAVERVTPPKAPSVTDPGRGRDGRAEKPAAEPEVEGPGNEPGHTDEPPSDADDADGPLPRIPLPLPLGGERL